MADFLHIALSFPTVVFTALLMATFLYWLMVIVGALGMDALDGVDGGDGLLDGAADGGFDLDGDGLLDGVGEGAEALDAMDASPDGGVDDLPETLIGTSVVAGLLAFLRIGKVPMTVILSSLILWGWLFTFLGHYAVYKASLEGWIAAVLTGGAALGGFVLSLLLTSLLMRPLARLFEHHTQHGQYSLVGGTCTVISQRVDAHTGRGEFADGGAGLILDIRCNSDNTLGRSDEVLIVEYKPEEDVYIVEPIEKTSARAKTKQAVRAGHRADSSSPLSEG